MEEKMEVKINKEIREYTESIFWRYKILSAFTKVAIKY